VQVTSTTEAKASERPAKTSMLARLNYPAAAAAIALIGWVAFVLARWQVWAKGHISLFIMSGVVYSHPAQMPSSILHVSSKGYDGQFYYRFALNPFNWHATAYGITIDYNYRYTRIGYPLVTWIVSLGQHDFVPVALVVVNLACVAAMGALGGMFARDSGRHALWGLLFVAYFGLVISVGRDTAEPLADACMLAGMLAYRRSRYLLAVVLIAYAAITNEPTLALPVGIALTRLYAMYRRRERPGRPDLAWVLPGAAYVVLQGIEHFVVRGKSSALADIKQNFTLPFRAMVPWIYTDFHRMSWTHLGLYDYNTIENIVLLLFVLAGLLVVVLRSTAAPVHERTAFVIFILVEMVMASAQFWNSTFGDGRTYIDCFLLAVIMLLATPRTAPAPGSTSALANIRVTNKYLAVAAVIAGAALILVARRHILFQ
jgi:hypothetical protein